MSAASQHPPRVYRARDSLGHLVTELVAVRRVLGWRCLLTYLLSVAREAPEILRTRSLAPADRRMAGRTYTMRAAGEEIVFRDIPDHGGSFGLIRELYGREPYFDRNGFGVAAGDVVVDLGANVGLFTVLAARLGASVLAVEARPELAERISETVALNDCHRAVKIECATVAAGTGLFRGGGGDPDLGPGMSLEQLLDEHDVRRVDFLKVDIEGSEFDLFSGPCAWLDIVGRIAMEVHTAYGTTDAIAERLSSAGFEISVSDHWRRPELGDDAGRYVLASKRGLAAGGAE